MSLDTGKNLEAYSDDMMRNALINLADEAKEKGWQYTDSVLREAADRFEKKDLKHNSIRDYWEILANTLTVLSDEAKMEGWDHNKSNILREAAKRFYLYSN